MPSLLLEDRDEEGKARSLPRHVFSILLHALLALATWLGLMLVGYALNPASFPQNLILLISITVPLLVGFAVNHFRQSEMATAGWLLGLIWLLSFTLWIADMPTGAGRCLYCTVPEKLSRTFLSIPGPSGLIDNDGPFLSTWPCAALIGYAIGARMALRRRRNS
jgi:hypothetical protein